MPNFNRPVRDLSKLDALSRLGQQAVDLSFRNDLQAAKQQREIERRANVSRIIQGLQSKISQESDPSKITRYGNEAIFSADPESQPYIADAVSRLHSGRIEEIGYQQQQEQKKKQEDLTSLLRKGRPTTVQTTGKTGVDFGIPKTETKNVPLTLEEQQQAVNESGLVSPQDIVKSNLELAKLKEPEIALRDVTENGFPKTIQKDGISYVVQEQYDKKTNKVIPSSNPNYRKVDDMSFKPSMYEPATKDDIMVLAQTIANYEGDVNSIPRQDKSKVFAEAKRINPKFNQANWTANKKLKENYTSGKYSQNIVSLNTGIGHLGDLVNASKALNNNDIQLLNVIANQYGRQTGDSAPDQFEAVRDAVANELATTFKGSSGTDIGLQNMLKTIYASQSPEQLEGVVKTYVKLLDSRLNALNNNYKKQTGVDFPVLDEDKKKIVDEIMGKNKQSTISEEDQQAIDWAKQNSSDPRAIQILKLHKIQ